MLEGVVMALPQLELQPRVKDDISRVLPVKHQELTLRMLESYRKRLLGGARQKKETADRSIGYVLDFIENRGKAPWLLTEADFEEWGYHVGVERGCAYSTQRLHQGAIRDFYAYLVTNTLYQNEVRKISGCAIRQVAFRHNMIVHKVENTGRLQRKAMSVAQVNQVMTAIDEAIFEAMKFRSKGLYPLMRDKLMLFLTQDLGLRADELLGIDLCDFSDDPRFPDFGKYACVSVVGKGDKGRTVHIENPLIPPLLKFYVEKVRPKMLKLTNPDEPALFLSERGNRLQYGSFWSRFRKALSLANLDFAPEGKRLSPHCLRHTSVTTGMVNGRSLEANRMKHGHVFGSTTQGYGHVPDEFIAREIRKGIRNNQKIYEEAQRAKAQEG
jgi:site-specific recombinase XerD